MNRRRASLAAVILAGLTPVGAACGSNSTPTTSTGAQGPIEVGAEAPTFDLPSAQGGDVSLADFVGKKPALLYFSMGPG
ncbi:MAG TPA: hypothetical protein VGR41_04920 [Actinomycetota bacterium]|nr:hypothetical protein [Actinomycetota bacterium]